MPQDLEPDDYIGKDATRCVPALFLGLLTPKYIIISFRNMIACAGDPAPPNHPFLLQQSGGDPDIWLYDESDFTITYNISVPAAKCSMHLVGHPIGGDDELFYEEQVGCIQFFTNQHAIGDCGNAFRGNPISAHSGTCRIQTLTRYTISNFLADKYNIIDTKNGFYQAYDRTDPGDPQPPYDPDTTHLLSNRIDGTSCYVKFDKNLL